MKTILKSKQNGFAIIEALIAFLLLGIGVAALLYLQGNLMGGSSASKARAEATELAKDRTEILRNYIDKDQYLAALGNVSDESSLAGVNATYAVSYTILQDKGDPPVLSPIDGANPLTTDKTQNLTVKVSWTGSGGNSDEVSLGTMLYFTKPEIVAAISDQNDGGDSSDFQLPSPWITGVEKAHESTDELVLTGDPVIDEHGLVTGINDDGTLIVSTAEIKIKTYTNTDGRSNVEVVRINLDGSETVMLTSFGGIVHRLKGEIILHHDADTILGAIIDNFQLLASPPSYCVAPICADGDCKIPVCKNDGTDLSLCAEQEVQYISYVCYVPGDCTYGAVNPVGIIDDVSCPDPNGSNPFQPPLGREDLNGGWYGRIGNFNLFLDNEKDMVCTADTVIGGANPNMTPSREYATHRWELRDPADPTSDKFIAGNEGINRPFDCDPDPVDDPTGKAFGQAFIIAGRKNGADACLNLAAKYQYTKVPPAMLSLTLPPENVIRIVGESGAIPVTLDPSDSGYPAPYLHPPLADLTPPYTENNVVQPTFDNYCIPAPVPVVP